MTKTNSDSVRVVLFDKAQPDRFLVVRERDDPDNPKLPGGKLEEGEEAAVAADRELLEEVGLKAKDIELQLVDTLPNIHDPLTKRYIFMGRAATEEVILSPEMASAEWVTDETVPDGENKGHILAAVEAARTKPEAEI